MLVFVPAELRPPVEPERFPDPAYIIPSIAPAPPGTFLPEPSPDPAFIVQGIAPAPPGPFLPEPSPDPAFIVQGIAPVPPAPPFQEPFPGHAFIAPGIAPAPLPTPAPFAREYLIDPSLIIDPIRELPPAAPLALPPAMPLPPLPEPVAPLPIIDRLETGKYYLQIAAYSNPDAVRSELSRLNALDSALANEAVVIRGVNPEYGAIYQILIGPLTHGESGALLQRFRGTHRDAFIRAGS